MKIGVVSDLHLEFAPIDLRNDQGVDVLVLAGDICVSEDIRRFPFYEDREDTGSHRQEASERYQKFFEDVSSEFPHVLMVMGNHEHYHGIFNKSEGTLRDNLELVSENITLLEDSSVEIDGVVFVGSTMWTDLNNLCPMTEYHLSGAMNDYRVTTFIDKYGSYRRMRPKDTLETHIRSRRYVEHVVSNCDEQDKKCVLITHHAPSKQSIHPLYVSDHYMNGGYASELSEILGRDSLKLSIHGHVHNKFDYMVGGTRVVCNPRGYPREIPGNENYTIKVVEL